MDPTSPQSTEDFANEILNLLLFALFKGNQTINKCNNEVILFLRISESTSKLKTFILIDVIAVFVDEIIVCKVNIGESVLFI